MIGAVVAPLRDDGGMVEQLTRLGLTRSEVVAAVEPTATLRRLADILDRADVDVLVVDAGLAVHDEALGDLVLDPRKGTAALVAGDAGEASVRVAAGWVVDAGSRVHTAEGADHAFTGAVRVSRADAAGSARAAREMADVADARGWAADPVDLLLVALLRAGIAVGEVTLDPWPWQRGGDAAAATALRQRLADLDVPRLRLARATKNDDDLWATLVTRRLSRRLTPVAIRRGATPNQVTALSFVVALAAAGCFAGIELGATTGLLLGTSGALLLQIAFVLDCVDGEIARYQRAFTPLGAWLDSSTDRLKEFVGYAGLALGAGGAPTAWLLAASALTLQTVRHATDDSFTVIRQLREPPPATPRQPPRPVVHWAKRVAHLPIGERWLVMSLGAALLRPQWALAALLGLGMLSLCYTCIGRGRRTRGWPQRPTIAREHEVVAAQVDAGPVAWVLGRLLPRRWPRRWSPSGRFGWLFPPALRLAEYAAVVTLASLVTGRATVAAFAMLVSVSYHHYDALYGVLHRLPPIPPAIRLAGLGAEGRVLLVALLALSGAAGLRAGLWFAAAWLAVLFLGYGSLRIWRDTAGSGA